MVKLCVGIGSVEELETYRSARNTWWGADYGNDLHVTRTRMKPTRTDEIAGKGSIYWVIAGSIRCRQVIHSIVPAEDNEGKDCCDILMYPDLVRTVPYPKRPFQGWRYLLAKDAPPDLGQGMAEDSDTSLAEELAKLGLL
jgi:hypothetical protein